jgi:hypothetical protein
MTHMRNLLAIAALLFASPVTAQVQGGSGQSDAVAATSLDLSRACPTGTATAQCPDGSVIEMPIGNGQGVVAADITGLTGSGATIVVERTVGAIWTARNLLVTGSAGAFAPSVTQDASFTLNTVGSRAIRFRVSAAGSGTARISAAATANSSVIQFGTSLPAGNLTIGKTILPDGAATSALQQSILTALGSPLQQGGAVSITGSPSVTVSNLPATQPVSGSVSVTGTVPVSGTFWPATQPVSGAVTVSNFPASQAISGTVGVSSLPAIPAGTNAIGSVAVSNLPATQAITGSVAATQSGQWSVGITGTPTVSVGNFPATQPVSGSVAIAGTPTVSVSNLPAVQAVTDVGVSNFATNSVAVGTTATLVAPARAGRRSITLYPTSNTTYFIASSATFPANPAPLGNGAIVTLPTSAAIYARGASGMTIAYVEMY